MTDNKFNDEEIIKDLTELSLYTGFQERYIQVLNATLDLINHQKTEIEQWKEEANRYQKLWCIAIDDIETAKAKAYKEFAEELENKINCRTTLSREQDKNVIHIIHNLLKEMVGKEE